MSIHSKNKTIIAYVILILLVVILSIVDLMIGSSTNATTEIIFNLRLPHTLCAIIAGSTLAVVGCMLQSSLANPLSSASTIGISQGASAGACISIVFFGNLAIGSSITSTVIFAFVFALVPTLIIFAISKFKNISSTSIILCGVAMSIFFGGLIALIEYFADSSKVAEVVFWTFGSLRNANSTSLIIMGVIAVIAFIFAQINALKLNAYESGDELAHSVGININRNRIITLLVSALSAAAISAFCGTINFIGLIAPHLMRKLVGSNYKVLIISSMLCGSSLLLLGDILSAIILPGAILPIGAITSLVGAPVFILILMKGKNI